MLNGGIACRRLVVEAWELEPRPEESKNGSRRPAQRAWRWSGNNALSGLTSPTDRSAPTRPATPPVCPNLARSNCRPQRVVRPDDVHGAGDAGALIRPGAATDRARTWTNWKFLDEISTPTCAGRRGAERPAHTWSRRRCPSSKGQRMAGIDARRNGPARLGSRTSKRPFTPRVQVTRAVTPNAVLFSSSNDVAMVKHARENDAQGGQPAWRSWRHPGPPTPRPSGPRAMRWMGTYVSLPVLPSRGEAGRERRARRFLETGADPDAWGAEAWQRRPCCSRDDRPDRHRDGPNGDITCEVKDARRCS